MRGMTMNSKNKKEEIIRRFEKMLAFKSDEEKLDFEAIKIHLDFIALLSELMEEQRISKVELAKRLGTSPSYITQLFSGDKLVNLVFIARIQRIFKISLNILTSKAPVYAKTFRDDLRKRGYQAYQVSLTHESIDKCIKRAS